MLSRVASKLRVHSEKSSAIIQQHHLCALTKRAGLLLKLVIVVRNYFVVQKEVIVVLIHLRKNVRQWFVHNVDDLFALEQLAVLLNREIAIKLVQYVLWIRCGFDAFIIVQCSSIHGIQHLTSLKFDGRVNPLIHEIRHCTLWTTKTTVNGVSTIWCNALGDVNWRRVKLTRVPKQQERRVPAPMF